ncbi:unnamed protein product [Diamesa hyperborea]
MAIKSVELYNQALDYANKWGKLVGLDIFTSKYDRFNLRVLLLMFDVVTYTMTTIYCIFDFYNDLEQLVFCLVTYGFATQGFAKIQTFWIHRKDIYKIDEIIREYHILQNDMKVKQLLEKYALFSLKGSKICSLLYVLCGIVLFSNFIFVKLLLNQKTLPFGFKLPWLEPYSYWGYPINLLHQLTQTCFTTSGFIFSDCVYITIVMQIYCIYDILQHLLDNLNETINRQINELENLESDIKSQLILIIELHQKLLNYIGVIEELYHRNLFVVIFSNVFQITLALFALVTSGWLPGILIIAIGTFQLLVVCMFGTILMHKNEQLSRKVYDISWENLSISNKKILLFVLTSSNRDIFFTYGVGILNFESFLAIYNKIYSFFMMLENVQE